MANYAASARTNAFFIDSIQGLIASLTEYGLTLSPEPYAADLMIDAGAIREDGAQSVKLYAHGGWPAMDEDSIAERLELDDSEDAPSKSLHEVLAGHLADDSQVAILIEVGMEKLRYLGGVAVAVNKAGDSRSIDLDDISDLARELVPENTHISHPSY